jgi:hypothetical protein
MRLVNIEPCEKLGHAMVLYATEGGMLVQIRSCDMPTIDAVPVVRCKDCEHWNKDAMACDTLPWVDSSEHANWYADDFCSYGERKDGGGK